MAGSTISGQASSAAPAGRTAPASRRALLLDGPIGATLLHLSWPNVLIMVAQAATGLVETWYLSRLGTDVLAGMALVFPVVMLMQMMSGGALGGGIASAIARAIGARRDDDADAVVLHALVLDIFLGASLSLAVLTFGPALYRALGGEGAALDAALAYSNVVFLGITLLWVMNGLSAVIRGTGNMLVPALGICGGVVILVPLSPLLIFGIGPFPRIGVAGGGVALLLYYLGGTLFFGWYILSGRCAVRFRWVRLRTAMFGEILRVGGLAALTSLQTNLTIAVATSLIGRWFGPSEVAGFGTAARLEYLLIPLIFGVGGTLVAMVGMNVGAGRGRRALRVALTGGLAGFVMTEAIGLSAAVWPEAWLRLFGSDPAMLATGAAYLRIVGPFYGFYGLGFALYFAGQGAGTLLWPLLAGLARLILVALGGSLALTVTGASTGLYALIALGLIVYGIVILTATLHARWGHDPAPASGPG